MAYIEPKDGMTVDYDYGCTIGYSGNLGTWIVATFCGEHDPTIVREDDE
jgi:hypothetical protein